MVIINICLYTLSPLIFIKYLQKFTKKINKRSVFTIKTYIVLNSICLCTLSLFILIKQLQNRPPPLPPKKNIYNNDY